MNKKVKFAVLISAIFLFGFSNSARASLNIDTTIDVPASCTALDTNGVVHSYASSYLAICAFEKALANGSISSMQLSNQYPSLGLFVTAINNVAANPASQYWALYQNGGYASLGITQLSVAVGDSIMFQLHDFSDKSTGDQVTLHVHSLEPAAAPSGSLPLLTSSPTVPPPATPDTALVTQPPVVPAAPVTPPAKKTFDIKKALDFLVAVQKEDGSFGGDIYTDWTALAVVSGNYQDQTIKLIKYLEENKIANPSLTDNERHAIALMSLGLNPYNTNGENYIKKIVDSFDGKQFGDKNEDNDDIFALIVLQNAGYAKDEKIINDDISFILSSQKADGSFDESVDMTGAGIEALAAFKQNDQVKNSLVKAEIFLKQKQKDDGGWNNASSTAWALEGITALNEKPEDWKKGDNTPFDYFATIQEIGGGVKNDKIQNKIWETAYVISILSGKSWNQVMQKFEKPTITPAVPQVAKRAVKKPLLTASVINAVTPPPAPAPKEAPRKSWFVKLMENIFGF